VLGPWTSLRFSCSSLPISLSCRFKWHIEEGVCLVRYPFVCATNEAKCAFRYKIRSTFWLYIDETMLAKVGPPQSVIFWSLKAVINHVYPYHCHFSFFSHKRGLNNKPDTKMYARWVVQQFIKNLRFWGLLVIFF